MGAVISRVGLIYFPDQQAALAGMRQALRPGGRVAAIVYATPSTTRSSRSRCRSFAAAPRCRRPLPGSPVRFSLGQAGVLEAAFEQAGLIDVEVRTVPAPLRLASTAECVRFEQESFGAFHQMLSGLDEAGRAAAWAEIAAELSQFDGADGFVGPCELLVGAARKPGPAGT